MVDAQLQGRPGDHRQGSGRAPLSDDSRNRFRRHRRELDPSRLEGGRQGHPQRLGLRRDASWRLRREGAGEGKLAGAASRQHERARRHGDRHCGLHRHAGGDGARAPRPHSDERTGGGNRRRRRRRLGRDCNSQPAWLSGHSFDRAAGGSRLPPKAGRDRDHRAPGTRWNPQNRWQKSVGRAVSTPSARPRWPMCSR